ncbi:MAG: aspartate aminotransferase family protein, partial [Candidatus Eremiobacteraeota bacterium]|nr:aspartate aminotransferase family protein [Candidatus Eremiobacteraeota bacterium]
AVPGARTAELIPGLREFESAGITALGADFPVFWESAQGSNIYDVDGNCYIDLTAAFGVANTGHANAYVASAIADQAVRLMHSMGDVHPTEVRVGLLNKLAQITPGQLSKTYLATTGAEAVEAALKTTMLYTKKPAVAAFKGAYHGLSFGALEVCGIEKFRAPFLGALHNKTLFFGYPARTSSVTDTIDAMRKALLSRSDVGGIIIEPIQGRAGTLIPPKGFLTALRGLCDELHLVLIFDEIYTGFGRTGTMFAAEFDAVVPDIMCIGKAMAGGFPISACVATPQVMDAWEPSKGEALHTSTYLGNPMGCAAALANIGEIERLALPARARHLGQGLAARLEAISKHEAVMDVRGRGLMWAIELKDATVADTIVKRGLQKGLILLQAGIAGNVISITPPLTITEKQLYHAIDLLDGLLKERVSA